MNAIVLRQFFIDPQHRMRILSIITLRRLNAALTLLAALSIGATHQALSLCAAASSK